MSRPFEIGDMVVLSDNEKAVITNVFMKHVRISCQHGLLKTVTFDNIKTIRTRRKGSADARAIVAKIGRQYHDYLFLTLKVWAGLPSNDIGIKQYWKQRKKGSFNHKGLLFQETKSMLK